MNNKWEYVQISIFDILENQNKQNKGHMTDATTVICLVVMGVNI